MGEFKNYFMITIGLMFYAFAWNFFMAPFKFVTGGITGIGAIVQYTTGIPMQYTYFAINVVLIIIAIWQLGKRNSEQQTSQTFPAAYPDSLIL